MNRNNLLLALSVVGAIATYTIPFTLSYAEPKPVFVNAEDSPKAVAPTAPKAQVNNKTKPQIAHTRPADKSFKNMDKNGDQKVSFDEFNQFQKEEELARSKKEIDRIMSSCDKNKDNIITLSELPSEKEMQKNFDFNEFDDPEMLEKKLKNRCMFPEEAMDFLDIDGDGSVSREELTGSISNNHRPSKKMERKLEKRMQKREAKRKRKDFSSCDKDGDQLLSLREAASMHCSLHLFTEQFDAHDTNKDQLVSVEEIVTVIDPISYRMPGEPSDAERRKKMPPLMRLESSMYECDKDDDGRLGKNETIDAKCEQDMVYFDTVDHNQDGYIDRDEIQRMRLKKRFDRMDKNHNGFLEDAEFNRMPARFMR